MWEKLGKKLSQTPKWRWWIYGISAILIAAYCAWLVFHKPDIKPGEVVTASPAKAVKGEPQVAIKPKQVIVYRDTVRVVEKLGLPPAQPQEQIIQAVDVPKLKYGGVSATFLDMSTGKSRTEIKANSAPWLAFRNDLAIGVGAGIGTQGRTVAGRIRLDVLQIKDVTLSPEIEGNYAEDRKQPLGGRFMLWAEWRP